MRVQRLDEPHLAELIVLRVERLGDSIGVDRQQIACGKPELLRPDCHGENMPSTMAVGSSRSTSPALRSTSAGKCPQFA